MLQLCLMPLKRNKEKQKHLTITLDEYYNWNVKWAGKARKLCWIIVNQAQKKLFLTLWHFHDFRYCHELINYCISTTKRGNKKYLYDVGESVFSEVQVRFPTHFWFWLRFFHFFLMLMMKLEVINEIVAIAFAYRQ